MLPESAVMRNDIAAVRRHHTCLRDANEHCRPLRTGFNFFELSEFTLAQARAGPAAAPRERADSEEGGGGRVYYAFHGPEAAERERERA